MKIWANSNNEIKEIYFATKSNVVSSIIATSYQFKQLGNAIYVKLKLFEYRVSLLYLEDVVRIE